MTFVKCFISTIPLHFIHSTIKVSNYYFVFICLIFIFDMVLQSFKETPSRTLFPGAMLGVQTQRILSLEGLTLKDTSLPFWSVSTLVTASKTQMKQGKQSFCVTISRRGKDGAQPFTSYVVYLIKVDMSFS